MFMHFGTYLNATLYVPQVWKLHVPEGFQELLWKAMNGSVPVGKVYFGPSDMGQICPCGAVLSLDHILVGCRVYDLSYLEECLMDQLARVSLTLYVKTLWPLEWRPFLWFPLLALKHIETGVVCPSLWYPKPDSTLSSSRRNREWLIGSYFWFVWKACMREIHAVLHYIFIPLSLVGTLTDILTAEH